MPEIQFLKEQSHYEDRYDRQTIEECLRIEAAERKAETAWEKVFCQIQLELYEASRYENRSETIYRWMREDQDKQKRYDNARIPSSRCSLCEREDLEFLLKDFRTVQRSKKEKELLRFTFGCRDCQYLLHIYEDGQREEEHLWQCPACKREIHRESKRVQQKITTRKWCECGYEEQDTLDLDEKPKRPSQERQFFWNEFLRP